MMLACFSAAGCASTFGGVPSPDQLHQAANARFAGGPIEPVLQHYGYPQSQFMSGDRRVFVWNTSATVRMYNPTTTTTHGAIGGEYPWLSSVPYREVTRYDAGGYESFACMMQVGVRPDGTVERIAFSGEMGACQNFMP